MIVYSEPKKKFSEDILADEIVGKIIDRIHQRLRFSVGDSEQRAFRNSLRYMDTVLQDRDIPEDAGVSIEYQIPQTGKRIDFIVSGRDEQSRSAAILIELKQWDEAELTNKDGVVRTRFRGGMAETAHPSYQAWSYAALLEDFNEAVRSEGILLKPCAYLHNYSSDGVITHQFYADHIKRAPVFLRTDAAKLREFIKTYVKKGDAGEVMYRIEKGRIAPSKNLADKLVSLMKGNREFVMIDDQKVVYETALSIARDRKTGLKDVLIIQGGPGTGKSVVAVNLLVGMIHDLGLNARYVTKNAAPRAVYASKLKGTIRKKSIDNLFTGSGCFTDCAVDTFDVLIVDEAHRLNEKSGMFSNRGENQIKEIIKAARFSIFFIDEDQRVTFKDIGTVDQIESWAQAAKAEVSRGSLASQFRCNGSDGYLAWLDDVLGIRPTANRDFDVREYDLKILSSPNDVRDLILEKNRISNKARLVAGYCWNWVSQRDPSLTDVNIPEHGFAMRWNLKTDGGLWILMPESVHEVGCIHTCQGLELDYVGVIIGPDLVFRDGKVVADFSKRARTDKSLNGLRQLMKTRPEEARMRADLIIRNTYRTLMTRGMKGCYIYCVDEGLRGYLNSRIRSSEEDGFAREGSVTEQIHRAIDAMDTLKGTE